MELVFAAVALDSLCELTIYWICCIAYCHWWVDMLLQLVFLPQLSPEVLAICGMDKTAFACRPYIFISTAGWWCASYQVYESLTMQILWVIHNDSDQDGCSSTSLGTMLYRKNEGALLFWPLVNQLICWNKQPNCASLHKYVGSGLVRELLHNMLLILYASYLSRHHFFVYSTTFILKFSMLPFSKDSKGRMEYNQNHRDNRRLPYTLSKHWSI